MTTNNLQENINIAAPPEAKLLEQQFEPQKTTASEIPRQDAERSNQPTDTTTSQAGNARFPYESGANEIQGAEVVRIPDEFKQEPVPDGRRGELPFTAADAGGGHAPTADPGFFTDAGDTAATAATGGRARTAEAGIFIDNGKTVQASPEPKMSWAGAPKNVVEGVVQPLTTGQFNLDQTSMSIPEQVLKTNNNTKIPLEVYNNTKIPLEVYNNRTPYGDAADRAENTVPLAPVLDPISPDGHGNLPVGVLKPSLS